MESISERFYVSIHITKLYHWCVANKLSINNDKTNFVLFHMKNKPVPKHFECIQTDVIYE